MPVEGLTSLHYAAESGHADVIAILIAAGAQVNACTTKGHTPLYQAAIKGHVEPIRLHSNAGADLDIKSQIGETPLDVAMYNRHREAARAIWQAGGSFTALVGIGDEICIRQLFYRGTCTPNHRGALSRPVLYSTYTYIIRLETSKPYKIEHSSTAHSLCSTISYAPHSNCSRCISRLIHQ